MTTIPEALKPYQYHGVELTIQPDGKRAIGACPWCDRNKFGVSTDEGLWKCFVCGEGGPSGGGNTLDFLRLLWVKSPTPVGIADLARDRGLLSVDTLSRWGVRWGLHKNGWILPGYDTKGRLRQVYRRLPDPDHPGKYRLLPTPGFESVKANKRLGHWLHAPIDGEWPDYTRIVITEGPWDGMVLDELLDEQTMVVSVPGCGSIGEPFRHWLPLFAGKEVLLAFDSDHPRGTTGSAGFLAMKRAVKLLSEAPQPPSSMQYLHWGPDGYDPDLPSGYDVRDFLTTASTEADRKERLDQLLARFQPVPKDWLGVSTAGGPVGDELLPCTSWKELVLAWKKALRWSPNGEGLDKALSVMLAVITSTKAVGDQLWAKIIGPAACGKSTLCEALSINPRYVVAKSTIRGFHSGYRETSDSAEDNSLVSIMSGKTLVTKDGDTLLQSPNLDQILAEARDLYDSVSRTHYRNKASKDYVGVRMTWLLCGTSSLRTLDSSELGERFLDCVIVEDIDDDIEDEIGWRVANRANRELSYEADGKLETRDGPEMVKAKQLTGGYIDYLRQNAQRLLEQVEASDDALRECQRLAKFVAYMRARPSTRQEEKAEREMSFRLISQLVRLAKCLAVVLNRTTLDEEVMSRVKKVALDTARGRTMELAKLLYKADTLGVETSTLADLTRHNAEKVTPLLRFLGQIGAAESFRPKTKAGIIGRVRWRLTSRLRQLYQAIVQEPVEVTDEP